MLLLGVLLLPMPLLFHSTRLWLAKTLLRMSMVPFLPVSSCAMNKYVSVYVRLPQPRRGETVLQLCAKLLGVASE